MAGRPICDEPGCGQEAKVFTADLKEVHPIYSDAMKKWMRQYDKAPVATHQWCRAHEQPAKRYLLDGTIEMDLKE